MKRNWYKFRVKYSKEMDDGKKKKVSEEYLVDAESFTETEKRANKAATDLIGTRDFDITAISLDIVNDVRQVCLADIKMTEKERMEVIFGIRPKLKLMNKKLQRLTKAVKYTSLGDVWAEIDYNARTGADKKNIVEQSMLRWKRAAKQ